MSLLDGGRAGVGAGGRAPLRPLPGLMACVPACPSGVRYDLLIERTRAERRARAPRGAPGARPRRRHLRDRPPAAAPAGDLLAARARHPAVRAGSARAARRPARPAGPDDAGPGERRMTAALLEGCVQRASSAASTAPGRALAADGCEVVVPHGQGCCGALALHAGREGEARRRATATGRRVRGPRAGGRDGGRMRLGDEGLRRPPGDRGGAPLRGGGARRDRGAGRARPGRGRTARRRLGSSTRTPAT